MDKKRTGAVFFVSTEGNDVWSGTLPGPNVAKTDGPFATLYHARDAAREVKPGIENGRIEIRIRGGKYVLDQPLWLNPQDSGTQDCPIVWSAYPGETPTISGGIQLKNWTPWKDGILQSSLPAARGGKWRFRQLFLNGRRQTRSRWPKLDQDNPLYGGWAMTEGPADSGANPHAETGWGCVDPLMDDGRYDHGTTDTFRYKEGFLKRNWLKASEGEVITFCGPGWGQDIIPIQSVNQALRTITLTRDIWQFDRAPWYRQVSWMPNNRFRVENILEELTDPGEWCLDTEEGVVYFKPPQGELAADDTVTVPCLKTLVVISGAEWISLEGLTFTETLDGDDTHRDGMAGYGAMFLHQGRAYCGEAVRMRRASHCRVEKCRFDQTGGNGVYLESGCHRNRIAYNTFCGCGANAIVLIGDHLNHPLYNRIEDNHIFECGVLNKFVAGVFLGVSDGNCIAHNHIHDMPHHAINLGTNGRGRNYVEYNRIERVAREIFDTGAINSWMDMHTAGIMKETERSGHVIRHNYIADTLGCRVNERGEIEAPVEGTLGIYLDDGSSNCLVYGNVILRVGFAVQVHLGKNNLIENNLAIDCKALLHLQDTVSRRPGNEHLADFMRGNRVERNIVVSKRAESAVMSIAKWNRNALSFSNHNLYFGSALKTQFAIGRYFGKPLSVDDWRRYGFDEESVFADPRFRDPASDDYSLLPDSPALKQGFQPIDMMRIGIRQVSPAVMSA